MKVSARETNLALLKDMSYEARMGHVRSSGRVNSRVAVAVEWDDTGKSQRAEGQTVDISAKGCLAVIPQGFAVGQKLRLFNLTNQNSCEAVLVWRGHEGRKGWELGLELQDPTLGLPKSSQSNFHRLLRRRVHFFLANQYLRNVKLARPWGFSEGGTHI
jgi:hypothetical protein